MKKLITILIIILFILTNLCTWYITKLNVKPEVVIQKQTKYITKLEKKIDVAEAKEKESKFLFIFNKDNIIWCGIGYALAII